MEFSSFTMVYCVIFPGFTKKLKGQCWADFWQFFKNNYQNWRFPPDFVFLLTQHIIDWKPNISVVSKLFYDDGTMIHLLQTKTQGSQHIKSSTPFFPPKRTIAGQLPIIRINENPWIIAAISIKHRTTVRKFSWGCRSCGGIPGCIPGIPGWPGIPGIPGWPGMPGW